MKNYFTEENISEAFAIARQKQLPLLIDFWAPGCKGCRKMDISTYQDTKVLSYIETTFIFIKFNVMAKNKVPRGTFHSSTVLWTPCFMVYANDGTEIRKVTGYLSPDHFIDEMDLGRTMALLFKSKSREALNLLEGLCISSSKDTIIQEALYWCGVAAFFLQQRAPDSLYPYWEKLMLEYPGSIWAERADCMSIQM
ncbi:Thioredoxin-like domain-containing protein [Chitinophaga sp. CF118]|uniref:thioredoxin family protein n=1 Tax=Chitinophaga sp. CF118 TaxID=1884367 RepID=UPI0008DED8FC|nr:thioredoxin family protein [Chitinophaga sp. CF118]SFD16165.1 Thioredoxin-like domain-containing protein [Chitinophaga sp. CF118]